MLSWMDVHIHLDYCKNPAEVVSASLLEGVKTILAQSTTLESQQKTLALANQFTSVVKPCLGYFPKHVHEDSIELYEKTLTHLEENIATCIAIGEVGLDFVDGMTPQQKERQILGFNRIIDLAIQYDKPLIIHTRGCRGEMMELLAKRNPPKVLLHSFIGGTSSHLKAIIDRGYFVSVGAGVLDKLFVQSWVKDLPIEHLLLETDGPLDWGEKGIIDSRWIPHLAEKVAEIKEITIEELHTQLVKNQAQMGFNRF